MAKEIRTILLSKVLSMEGIFQHKYSTAYNCLLAIIELEKKETHTEKLPNRFFERFDEITKLLDNLDEKVKDIPLLIVEQYFIRNSSELSKYIFIQYGKIEGNSDLQCFHLYEILEAFFQKVYLLCVEIADYYSLEIKLKRSGEKYNSEQML